MRGRTRAIVASLAVALIGAVAALAPSLGVAAGGEGPVTVPMPSEPMSFEFAFSTKRLPVGKATPTILHLGLEEPPRADGSGWIGISSMAIDLDKPISLDAGAAPTCSRQLLMADTELEDRVPTKCERAVVGRSKAKVYLRSPYGDDAVKEHGSGAIYNGGARGGVTHLIVELLFEPPGESIYMTVPIGGRATTRVPKTIGIQAAALYDFEIELNRPGFVTAECPTGKLTASVSSVLVDGTKAQEEAIRPCTR